MTVYWILLAVSAALGIPLCHKRFGRAGKAAYCIIIGLVFIVVSAMRFQVGYDFHPYSGMYYNMRFNDLESLSEIRTEKGFMLPLYVLSLGYEQYYVVFIYTSIIIYAAVFAMIGFRSEIPWVSVVSFLCFGLYFNSLCFLRQFMAALIIAYAIKYVLDNKDAGIFLILVICAASFHWSALIMAALYIFIKIKPSWIYLGIVTAGTILFCIFSRSAMMFIIDKISVYQSYNPDTNVEAANGLSPRYTIMFGVVFIICFLLRGRLMEKNPNNGIYLNCLMFTVVFEAMGIRHAILSRFAILTYIPPLLFMLPDAVAAAGEWLKEKKGKGLAAAGAAAAAVYSAGVYTILMLNNYNGVMPYVSQFNRPYDVWEDRIITESDELDEDEDPEADPGEDPAADTGGDSAADTDEGYGADTGEDFGADTDEDPGADTDEDLDADSDEDFDEDFDDDFGDDSDAEIVIDIDDLDFGD